MVSKIISKTGRGVGNMTLLEILSTNSRLAFADIALLYGLLAEATNDDFAAFTDPTNHVAHLILIHFFLIEHAIGFSALGPAAGRFVARKKMNLAWLERLAASVPRKYHQYLVWPQDFGKKDT